MNLPNWVLVVIKIAWLLRIQQYPVNTTYNTANWKKKKEEKMCIKDRVANWTWVLLNGSKGQVCYTMPLLCMQFSLLKPMFRPGLGLLGKRKKYFWVLWFQVCKCPFMGHCNQCERGFKSPNFTPLIWGLVKWDNFYNEHYVFWISPKRSSTVTHLAL